MRDHYEELFHIASHEHSFANMQLGSMLEALEEIQMVTDDNVVKLIVQNALERRAIDIAIHCKKQLSKD